jgi:hypothetical protein
MTFFTGSESFAYPSRRKLGVGPKAANILDYRLMILSLFDKFQKSMRRASALSVHRRDLARRDGLSARAKQIN